MKNVEPLEFETSKIGLNNDELYFQIWEQEQEHTKTRWNVTTFFFSISFAIFGFSLQTNNPPLPPIITHGVALAIYWFAFVLFWRFNSFTDCLRKYLREMEVSGQVKINVQTRANQAMKGQYGKWLSTFSLMLYFGILYSVAVGVLWWQRIRSPQNSVPFLLSLSIGIPVVSMMPNHHTLVNQAFSTTMTFMQTAMERVQMTGNTDTDFATMMIPHHQGAIEMAKTELQYGTDPRLRRLAQEIIVTQQSEIELMQLTLKHPQSLAPSAK